MLYIVIVAVLVIAIACVYGFEQHDKDRRERDGLPPRKHVDSIDDESEMFIMFRK